jgi:hypothetical protein
MTLRNRCSGELRCAGDWFDHSPHRDGVPPKSIHMTLVHIGCHKPQMERHFGEFTVPILYGLI